MPGKQNRKMRSIPCIIVIIGIGMMIGNLLPSLVRICYNFVFTDRKWRQRRVTIGIHTGRVGNIMVARSISIVSPVQLVFVLGALLFSSLANGQEVAEIPFFHAPTGSAALGGGIRTGQSPYLASDNEDQRQADLIPLYLYNGRRLFARGTAGGVHFVKKETFEF